MVIYILPYTIMNCYDIDAVSLYQLLTTKLQNVYDLDS